MRYTKELQENVCNDIKYGLTPQQCAEKYNIPIAVVIKWNGLEMSEQRAAEIALRKYQNEVSDTEVCITNKIGRYLSPNISDDDFDKVCENVSKPLYKLVADVVKKERCLNPKDDKEKKSNSEIISELVNKWINNQFIKRFAI